MPETVIRALKFHPQPMEIDMESPIQLKKNADKSWTLTYYGHEIGWIQKATSFNLYRSLSVHGQIIHRSSLKTAQEALLEAYH